MINRHIIQVILSDHNINKVFARGSIDNYHKDYLSSFYIHKCKIRRHNVAFKEEGQNIISAKLDFCFENNEYSQLQAVSTTIRKTLHYIELLKKLIEEVPEEIKKATNKYLPIIESKKMNAERELIALISSADNTIDKIKISGYFEKTETYKNVLISLKTLVDEIKRESTIDAEKVNLLKSIYEEHEDYLKTYIADISPITNEIDIASEYIHELFNNIRLLGVVTCNADLFIENKKNNINNNIEFEIINIQDIKYKNLYLFKDNSILFENVNGSFLEIKDNDHLDTVQNEIMINSISIEFKKYPKIEKLFKNAIISNPNYLNRIIGIADQYKKYSSILKDTDFKILDELITYTHYKSDYERLEEIRVKMIAIIKTHNVKVFAYSIASTKYKHLYDESVMKVMEMLYDLNIKKETLQEQIGSKIAAYNTPEEFYSCLRKLHNILTNFTKDQILEKVNKMNTKIIYETEHLIILEINSFIESSLLGAPSWCITRKEEYFNSYTKNGAKQYIVYNFQTNILEKETLIGITLNNNIIKAANYRNNDNINITDKDLTCLINLIKTVEIEKNT